MSDFLVIVVLFVMVFGGAVGCGIKALLGIEQSKFLYKRFAGELKEMKNN